MQTLEYMNLVSKSIPTQPKQNRRIHTKQHNNSTLNQTNPNLFEQSVQ